MIRTKKDCKGIYLSIEQETITSGCYIGQITDANWIEDMPTKIGPQTVLSITIVLDSNQEFSSLIFLNKKGQSPLQELLDLRGAKAGKKIRPESFIGLEVGVCISTSGTRIDISKFFHPDDYTFYM